MPPGASHERRAFYSLRAGSALRTRDNKLSVWKADTPEDIDDAIVALALNRDSIQKISCFLLNENDLEKIHIKISDEKKGEAAGLDNSILNKHRDLIEIDYWRLGFLAEYMTELAKDKKNRADFSEKRVKTLLEKYKMEKKIIPEQVKEQLRTKLEW